MIIIKKKLDQGKKVILNCKPEHIMTYDLKFKFNKNTGLYEGFISGGHVGIYRKQLEKAGEIIVLLEEELVGGARAVKYKHNFGSFIEEKTEYPLTWSAKDIMKANVDIFQNYTKEKLFNNGMFARKGISKDGVEIVVVFKKGNDSKIKIVTAFPYSKKIMDF